jgi:hypothetical protein
MLSPQNELWQRRERKITLRIHRAKLIGKSERAFRECCVRSG